MSKQSSPEGRAPISTKPTPFRSRVPASAALFSTLLTFYQAGFPGTASAAETPQVHVVVRLQAKAPSAKLPAGSLLLRCSNPPGDPLELARSASGDFSADLPAGSAWEMEARLPGWWALPTPLVIGEAGAPLVVDLPVWPTGKVAGIAHFDGSPPGQGVRLGASLFSPPGTPRATSLPKGRVECALDEKGAFTCELPAVALDLSLQANGFVPDYRWGLAVPKGGTLELGTLNLKRGASLVGWVRPEEGELKAGKGLARLSPLLAAGGGPEVAARLSRSAAEGRVRDDGFFQLAGLPAGSYVLEVEHPGYATGRAYPIEIWPGAETSLRDAVVLQRPLSLSLSLDPPRDWLDKPWQVRIFRASDFSASFDREAAFDGPSSGTGAVRVDGQSPGTYFVTVMDSLGNSLFSDFGWTVDGPASAAREIRLRLVTLKGRIRLGEAPVAATLWFGGAHGAQRVEMSADRDGKFHGVLPKPGTWLIEIQVESETAKFQTHTKAAVHADSEGRASLDLKLPDTVLFGKVLGEDGRPAAGAMVSATTNINSLADSAGIDGGFEMRGLPEGVVELSSRLSVGGKIWTSDPLLAPLAAGRPTGPVLLSLRQSKEVRGTVLSSLGPVAGATVKMTTQQPRLGFGASGRTDLQGAFVLQLPAAAQVVSAVVSPPGFALKAFELTLTGEPLVLSVSDAEGTLQVQVPYSEEEVAERSLETTIFQDGTALSYQTLYFWSRGHGQPPPRDRLLTLPALAPGQYTACVGPHAALGGGDLATWKRGASCTTEFLYPGATLRLDIEARKD